MSAIILLIGGYYYTDVYIEYNVYGLTNPNWNSTPNYYELLMFSNYEGSPNYHLYLSSTEINFYTTGTTTTMNTFTTYGGPRPTTKTAFHAEVTGYLFGSIPTYIGHYGDFSYGIPHVDGGGDN